jgi:hypothetical protein
MSDLDVFQRTSDREHEEEGLKTWEVAVTVAEIN